MAETTSYQTPLKQPLQYPKVPETADISPGQKSALELQVRVDYKTKTFKLMKQLAESQVINKKSYTQIRHLQRQIDTFKKQFQKVFAELGVRNLQEYYKKIQVLVRGDGTGRSEKSQSEKKVVEWTNIIEQYKRIINAQQYKFIKLEQQLKIAEVKIKRYEQNQNYIPKEIVKEKQSQPLPNQEEINKLRGEVAAKEKERASLQAERSSLEEELSILKREYKQLLMQRESLKEMYEQLQNKYNLQIQHFEEMEKHVEDRLIEVQRQMNFYRQERQEHLQKIDLMRKEITLHQTKAYFSFGGVKHIASQTESEEEGSPFNSECLEISIKTLLEENDKLKNTLLVLYTKKETEELPKEIQLQLKILLNMHDANIKYLKREDKTQLQRLQIGIQERFAVENRILQVNEAEQDASSPEGSSGGVFRQGQSSDLGSIQSQGMKKWQSSDAKRTYDNEHIQI